MSLQSILIYAGADISEASDWLPEANFKQWLYEGCSEKPKVGSYFFTSLKTKFLLGSIAEVWTKWSTTPSQQGNTEMPPSSFPPTEREVTRAISIPAVEATRDVLEAIGRTSQAADSDLELQMGEDRLLTDAEEKRREIGAGRQTQTPT